MPTKPEDDQPLREYIRRLKARRSTAIGRIGERLFQGCVEEHKGDIKGLHKHGADFLIKIICKVDVKARGKAEVASGGKFGKIAAKNRLAGVSYAYVVFWQDIVEIHHELDVLPAGVIRLSWAQATHLAGDYAAIPAGDDKEKSNSGEIKKIKSELANWIKTELGCRPRVIHRTNRKAQESMSLRGWGPDTFHEKSGTKKRDLIVLLYFDAEAVYRVLAYPTKWMNRIDWHSKPVGPNVSKRVKSFDPKVLSDIFIFENIDEFKATCASRFALAVR